MVRSYFDHEIGLIAQDVEQVVPEVVRSLGNSTLKGIEYQKLTAILIEAVKELSGKLNELNNKVNKPPLRKIWRLNPIYKRIVRSLPITYFPIIFSFLYL